MNDTVTNFGKYQRGWTGGLPETPCGFGSTLGATALQREWIPSIISKYSIQTVADIGAGDLNWIQKSEIPGICQYRAFDLIPRHGRVQQFNLLYEVPPAVDLIMCLWVLNHFTKENAAIGYQNIQKSGAKYLMITDRPIWYEDHPECLRDLPYIERIILNEKQDQILLVELC